MESFSNFNMSLKKVCVVCAAMMGCIILLMKSQSSASIRGGVANHLPKLGDEKNCFMDVQKLKSRDMNDSGDEAEIRVYVKINGKPYSDQTNHRLALHYGIVWLPDYYKNLPVADTDEVQITLVEKDIWSADETTTTDTRTGLCSATKVERFIGTVRVTYFDWPAFWGRGSTTVGVYIHD
mmetsp:Transcript_22267/g.31266  ORF Transcript_22267/g.31266 Transcript_22267/m.31266 type:complete len:180 (+) Transcript_22267:408-947(+)